MITNEEQGTASNEEVQREHPHLLLLFLFGLEGKERKENKNGRRTLDVVLLFSNKKERPFLFASAKKGERR